MLFTRAERYALRCVIHLAGRPSGTLTTLQELSEKQGISKQYLANIMCHLTAAGLVHTYRGMHGGYALGRPSHLMTMADIWDAVRSADAPINCVTSNSECPRLANCPIRHLFEDAFKQLHEYLARWTVQKLSAELEQMHMPARCGAIPHAATGGARRHRRYRKPAPAGGPAHRISPERGHPGL